MNTLKTLALTGVLVLSMVLVSTGFAAGNSGTLGIGPASAPQLPASSVYPFGETSYVVPAAAATVKAPTAVTTTTTTTKTTPAATTTVTPTATTTSAPVLLSYAPGDAFGYTNTGEYVGNSNYSIKWYNSSPNASTAAGQLGARK
jgi:hypothetical protein